MDADGGGDELNFLREMGLLVASILKNQLGLSAAKEASQMEIVKTWRRNGCPLGISGPLKS